MGGQVLLVRGDAQSGQPQEARGQQKGEGCSELQIESRAQVRQASREAHMKSPTVALEETPRRTVKKRSRTISIVCGGRERNSNVFSY